MIVLLSTAAEGRGSLTTTSYDLAGRQSSKQDPLGRRWTTIYDVAGQVVREVDPRGHLATRTYDLQGQLIETSLADGTRITQAYDALGQLILASDATGLTTQTWDSRGLLATAATPAGAAPLSYIHDSDRRRVGLVHGSERHTWVFDCRGLNTRYVDPDSGITTYEYEAAAQKTQQSNWNGTATTWIYDRRGLIQGIRHRKSDGAEIGSDQYLWDGNGNPLLKTALGGRNTWSYDTVGRLIAEQHQLQVIATWSYDPAGNRLTQDRTQVGVRTLTQYAYDPADQLLTATQGATVSFAAYLLHSPQSGAEHLLAVHLEVQKASRMNASTSVGCPVVSSTGSHCHHGLPVDRAAKSRDTGDSKGRRASR